MAEKLINLSKIKVKEIMKRKIITIKSDSQIRCSLCSKAIDWEPIYKNIDGTKIPFDSMDCVNTYRKFKSLYGQNFK